MNSLHRIIGVSALLFLMSCNGGAEKKETSYASGMSSPSPSDSSVAVKETAFPEKVYWGDQHVHTAWSGDAGAAGTRVGPEDAVRFAMGEAVAHLHLLWFEHKLQRRLGADGVYRFAVKAAT
jgi:hypothetical protein